MRENGDEEADRIIDGSGDGDLIAGCSGSRPIWIGTRNPELKSATTLAFGPEDILFIGDAKGAALVVAVATGDTEGDAASAKINVSDLGTSLASLLSAKKVTVNDLAVNPGTGSAFLAVTADDAAAIVKVDGGGKLTQLELKDIRFAKVDLKDAPEDKVVGEGRRARNNREQSITDIAYFEGKILVSGLSSAKARLPCANSTSHLLPRTMASAWKSTMLPMARVKTMLPCEPLFRS